MDVWIVAADDMAGGNINDVLALVSEKALYRFTKDANRRPASEQDGILERQSFRKDPHNRV
jgi:hypothetical protein